VSSGKNQRPRPRGAQPLRGLRRRLLLTAVACLAGQGAAFAHLVLVQHATCVEHDALVHSDAGSAGPEALPPTSRPTPLLDSRLVEAGHEDDHCLAVSLRRREAPATTGAAAGPVPAPADAAAYSHPVARGATGVPLLHLAPKSSPPPAVG
jgi:hypothetical protein